MSQTAEGSAAGSDNTELLKVGFHHCLFTNWKRLVFYIFVA